MIGNENVKKLLRRLVQNGRVPHSLLFAGPEGVGKKAFAIDLARMMLCPENGCGGCAACGRIGTFDLPKAEKGEDYDRVFLSGHPDVGLVIPYKRNLRVGAIRELEREANFNPFEGRKRIFVIDEAEKMNAAAANALLKTLEEPPPTTYLILITSRPDSLLSTIRSRCQTVRFAPVPARDIEELLMRKRGFSPEDAALAAKVSLGRVGRAISMDLDDFKATRATLLEVLKAAVLEVNITTMLRNSEQLSDAKNKDRFEENIGIMQSLVHDALSIASGSYPLFVVNGDIAADLIQIANGAGTKRLSEWQLAIEEMLYSLQVNANKRVAADALFVRMSA